MGEVLLIGGSPMIGKSTVAIEISSRLKWNCISSDDIGEALQTVVNINPFQNKNFLEYYAVTQCSKLIDDIIKYHKKIQPAILRLADIHLSWGNSTK